MITVANAGVKLQAVIVRGIAINNISGCLFTSGLRSIIGTEIKLVVLNERTESYIRVLAYLVNYILDHKPVIKPNETISYHSWLLKFVPAEDHVLDLWEVKSDGGDFVQGADHAIQIIAGQEEVCRKLDASPNFPTFGQKIVISKGVYEGLAVEAVRYPSPEHMTGWWLTTDLYDGNIESLMTVHYFHVAFKRPDLIKYLALPYGFRFFAGKREDVWLDKKILLSEN